MLLVSAAFAARLVSGAANPQFRRPAGLPINPGSGLFAAWGDLDEKERAEQARKMEIYAAMVENADWNIGRVLQALDDQAIWCAELQGATSARANSSWSLAWRQRPRLLHLPL